MRCGCVVAFPDRPLQRTDASFLRDIMHILHNSTRHHINDKSMKCITVLTNGRSSEYNVFPELAYYLVAVVYAELLLPLLFQLVQTWMRRALERFREVPWICCWSLWQYFNLALTLLIANKIFGLTRMYFKSGKLLLFATSIMIACLIGAKWFRVTQLCPTLVAACQAAFMFVTMWSVFVHAPQTNNQLPYRGTALNNCDEQTNEGQTKLMCHDRKSGRTESQQPKLYCNNNQKSCSQHCGNMYQQHSSAIFIGDKQHHDKDNNQILASVSAKWLAFQRYFTADVTTNCAAEKTPATKPPAHGYNCGNLISGCCGCSSICRSVCCASYSKTFTFQPRGCLSQWQQADGNCCCGGRSYENTYTSSYDICCATRDTCCWSIDCGQLCGKEPLPLTQLDEKKNENKNCKTILTAAYGICSYCCCCWCGFCCSECCYCNSSDSNKCGKMINGSESLEKDENRRDLNQHQFDEGQEKEGNSENHQENKSSWIWLAMRRNEHATRKQCSLNKSSWHNPNISENLKLQLITQYHRNLLAIQYMVNTAASCSPKSRLFSSIRSANRPAKATAEPMKTVETGHVLGATKQAQTVCRQKLPKMQVQWHLHHHKYDGQGNNFTGHYHQLLLCCCVANEQQLKTNNLCKIFCNNRKRQRRRRRHRRHQHWLRQHSNHINHNNNSKNNTKTKNSGPKSQGTYVTIVQPKCAIIRNVNRRVYKIDKSKKLHERIGNFKKIIALNIFKAVTGIMSLSPPSTPVPSLLSPRLSGPQTTASTTTPTSLRFRVSFASGTRESPTDIQAAMSATTADITALIPLSLMWAATTTIAISTPTATAAVMAAAIPTSSRIYKRRVKSNLVWLFIGLVWFESPKLVNCNIVSANTGCTEQVQSQQQHHEHQQQQQHEQQKQLEQQQHEQQQQQQVQQQQQQHVTKNRMAKYPWTVSSIERESKSDIIEFFTSNRNCTNTFKTNSEKRQAILKTLDYEKKNQSHNSYRSSFDQPSTLESPKNQTAFTEEQRINKDRRKIRSRRHNDNYPVTYDDAAYKKQEQASTALNDLARLESIKRQILSKLGLSHKPNVVHPLPKQFIWDTIYRADGIRSVNDFDFNSNDRTTKHIQRAYSPSRRMGALNLHRKSNGRTSDIVSGNYVKESRRKSTGHRSKHTMDNLDLPSAASTMRSNKISYKLYNNNRYSNNNMKNTLLDATQHGNKVYYNSTHHTDSNHKQNNLSSSSVKDTKTYDLHKSDYNNNQNRQNYFKDPKSATYLFPDDLDGDVDSVFTNGINYNIYLPDDDLDPGDKYAENYVRTESQSHENSVVGWEDYGLNEASHIRNPKPPYYRQLGDSVERGPSPDSDLVEEDNFVENEDFFGNTQEIITFAEKGTVFWHHRLVEFSRQISEMHNQRLFIRNAEIHIRIDKVTSANIKRKGHRERHNLNIWIFQLVDKNYTQKAFDQVTRLCAAFTVNTKHLGWQKLDLTKTVQAWYSTDNYKADKLKLLIDCSGCGKHYVLHLFENPNGHVQRTSKDPAQRANHYHGNHHQQEEHKTEVPENKLSQLGVVNRSDTFSLLWEHIGNKSYRYKYYKDIRINNNNNSNSDKYKLNNTSSAYVNYESNPNRPFIVLHTEPKRVRRVRRRAIDCMGASHGRCCKESFYVSFKALGWDDWIIAPRGYFANYCRGDCTGPFRTPDTFQTFHAHFIEEYRKMGLLNGMQPCCAPVKFSSMSLIYYGDEGIIKRDLPKMVVDECGCP